MSEPVSWIDRPGNREKFAGWLGEAQAYDHADAVARWPWYARLVHRVFAARCPACLYVRHQRQSVHPKSGRTP